MATVEAIAKALAAGDKFESDPHLVQMNASSVKIEIDRAGLPADATDVVTLALNRCAAKEWEEIGRCTVAGGVLMDKSGTPIATSSVTFRLPVAAGTLLRVAAEVKGAGIWTTVRLTWS